MGASNPVTKAINKVWQSKINPIAKGWLMVRNVKPTVSLRVSKINCVKTEGSL